ncbi:acyl carrier protein [Brenneria goodwinii]|uniref:acyl carrier protein n=1 Tax=Brenneria goodwinii TaxID=1109412 RepID=UPI000EF276F9|nr:acyl carrier protein [Brenneria goodwinii]MCG8157173.1 acyl carrier protein [Brenneria goodwinii]MCG8160087.1 acyl carrier protein [Brenneria goodwinii]MCG8164610.1 acyl carrier protein [Brenneria goodwinii]MCG8170684.1 acyl carrier protein [Brenneria goodwinii]MCG8174212.1 acyl carrier protein [Brenneria goodwinii]
MNTLNELQLREIVKKSISEVLEIKEEVDNEDNFFTVGGDSLTALDVIDKINDKTGKKIPLRDFLAEPTPEALAILLNKMTGP